MINTIKSKLVLGLVIFTLVISALVVSGTTQVAAQTKTQVKNCSVTTTLKMGSKGKEVSCLQSKLGVKTDGVFGISTKNAVMSFQKENGIMANGVVSASTRSALDNMSSPQKNSSSQESPTQEKPSSKNS